MMEKARENDPKHEDSVPILNDEQNDEQKPLQELQSSFQKLWHNSIFRSAVKNGLLILTW